MTESKNMNVLSVDEAIAMVPEADEVYVLNEISCPVKMYRAAIIRMIKKARWLTMGSLTPGFGLTVNMGHGFFRVHTDLNVKVSSVIVVHKVT